jgi:uncharacterized protein YbaR (Trm112 family)
MPIDPEFLQKLRCPKTHKPLGLLGPEPLAALNREIAAGRVSTAAGRRLAAPLAAALLPAGESFVYAIDDEIPILLVDEAIPLRAAADGSAPGGSESGGSPPAGPPRG